MNAEQLKEKLEEIHLSGYGWAVSCCQGNRRQAEDVLQSVYLKILEGKAVWSEKSSFKTWFFAVIRKTAIDYRRRVWFRRTFAIRQPAEEVSENSGLQNRIEYSEEQAYLLKVLKKLPKRQKEVLHLVFYQDLTLSQAAEVLQISVGSVRQHYERGKKRLRILLEKEEVYETHWKRKENTGIV